MIVIVNRAQINTDIRDREVRLVGDDGSQLGIVSSRDALRMAYDKNMDLVKIAPKATPPVCKIMDYSKYCYEQKKREREAHKNQKIVEIKEIRMFSAIDDNDFNTKLAHARKFLSAGNKLKVSVRFRKRAIVHPHLGAELLERFAGECKDLGSIEKAAKMDGRSLVAVITPKFKPGQTPGSDDASGKKPASVKTEAPKLGADGKPMSAAAQAIASATAVPKLEGLKPRTPAAAPKKPSASQAIAAATGNPTLKTTEAKEPEKTAKKPE